jgi:hypothetical protein
MGMTQEQRYKSKKAIRNNRYVLFTILLFVVVACLFVAKRLVSPMPKSDIGSNETADAGKLNPASNSNSSASSVSGTSQKEDSQKSFPNTSLAMIDPDLLRKDVTSNDVVTRNRTLEAFKRSLVEIELRTGRVDELEDLLRGMNGTDEAFAPLVAAAGAVGTPAVQTVLRALVLERTGDWRTFSAVVPTLGGLVSPTNDTLNFLSRLAQQGEGDFATTAALALGGSVHTLSQTDPVRGERILENYISRIENPSGDVEDLKDCLAVLGNAGLPSTARAILAQTRHPQADVRSEAVMALRFIRTPEVEQRLVQIMESDVDLEVRMRVVDALVHAPVPDSFLPVAQRIVSEVKKVPVLLREKAIDLFLHFELDEPRKTALRNWALGAAQNEPEAKIKSKLISAAQELMSR